jgi:hypothetical protein
VTFGFRGVFVISFGIAAYVLKDRLKDKFRQVLTHNAAKVLADSEQNLFAEETKIGRIREWFGLKKSTLLPGEVLDLRRSVCLSEVEQILPEDVFHYRRVQDLKSRPFKRLGPWAIQETLRINLDRYLKYMDDPIKEFSLLDDDGRLATAQSHRAYYFYFCVHNAYSNEKKRNSPLKTDSRLLYRIVMDKNGVDRIEHVT